VAKFTELRELGTIHRVSPQQRKALGERIRKRRVELGLSLDEIAAACGVTRQAVSGWEIGKHQIKVEHLAPLAQALRLDADLLWEGPQRYYTRKAQQQASPPFDDAIREIAAGIGGSNIPYSRRGGASIIDWWALPGVSRLAHIGAPDDLRIFAVHSDTMEPTIRRGNYVVVDTTQRRAVDGGIFAIDNGFSAVLKRIHTKPGDRLELTNDADHRPPDTFPAADVAIIGRCIAQIGFL